MKPHIFLQIISPEKTLFKGNVTIVRFPGKKAPFVVLKDHAPIVSLLEKGVITFEGEYGKKKIPISGGFVQVRKNRVYACIDP
ncbi:MAG: F0F1 ATP synthase subunit epsilon [Bacteroidales bacterium]|nr:F0F1 ATP synthase subunit epsilon [Bacteroidales bacterium]